MHDREKGAGMARTTVTVPLATEETTLPRGPRPKRGKAPTKLEWLEKLREHILSLGQDLLAEGFGTQINYHPQSGWFEDAPLKGGAVIGLPPQGALWQEALFRGHCDGLPPQGAEGLPGPAPCGYFPYLRGAKSPNASCSARFSCSS